MTVALALLLLGSLAATVAPRLLARASWPEREPVLGLWVWQCLVAAVLLCCVLAMALLAAGYWPAVRDGLFAPAPHAAVVDAYALTTAGPWAGVLALLLAAGGVWTASMLLREVVAAAVRRRRRRAELLARCPRLPGEAGGSHERVVVLESERPDAYWLPGSPHQLVVTTGALRRLSGRQLDAVLAHERGHARARHDWLLHCSAALAAGFPRVPLFAAFGRQVPRLVELAADDVASRRVGRLETALALVGLNEDRGAFAGVAAERSGQVAPRVHRLLAPATRLTAGRRLRVTALAALVPALPLLVAFAPGLRALG